MKQKIILSITILSLLSLAVFVSAISDDEARRRNEDIMKGYSIKNGYVSEWQGPSGGEVTFDLRRGWNLIPMFLAHSKDFSKSTCSEDVFENLWFYSPSSKSYKEFPSQWYFLINNDPTVSIDDSTVKNEINNKYYNIFLSSMWVYTPEECSVVGGDSSPVSQSIRENLILKAGWNFVYHDALMYIYNNPLGSSLEKCGLEKVYKWNADNQQWESAEDIERISVATSQIFDTYLVKTNRDCKLLEPTADSSGMPSFPE